MAIFFKNHLFLLLGVLALATNVLSARVSYAARIANLEVGNRVSKSANIPDDQVQKVLDRVHGWSRGEFRASQSRHGMVIIQGTQDFPDKNSANTAVQNIQHQVSVNVNNAGGDC